MIEIAIIDDEEILFKQISQLIRYQFWMVAMVMFEIPLQGLEAAISILLLLILVFVFSYFVLKSSFFKKSMNF